VTAEAAVQTAEERRLDLRNTADRVADAERRVGVAANALLPGLDVAASATTPTEDARLTSLQFHRTEYNFGATLDLPFDRLAERNTYRASLIALEVRHRDLEAFRDNVARDVRQAVRRLGQAKENYDIQRDALRLAERRIESTTLFLQAGRAETRDVLDAQEDLVTAQNAVTRALVEHTVARLELFRDMGTLQVDEKGLQYDDEHSPAGP
jgi:outer membrane protein TolC